MKEHNLFKPKSIDEGKHAVVGNCNGYTMQQRWEAETPAFAKKIVEYATFGKESKPPQILDYGCGVGRLAKEILLKNPALVTGVDDSAEMRLNAHQYVNDNNFTVHSIEDLDSAKDSKFDLAYCVYVLQHVPAVEIREILSRIHSHLKDDGYFIYCSSVYRMAIRFDGQGFFDDRFLGVDLHAEVERYFEKIGPLFEQADYKDNPILQKMITGCYGGLEHPAFVYKKRAKSPGVTILGKSVFDLDLHNALKTTPCIHCGVTKLPHELTCNSTISQSKITPSLPKKLILINRLSPGDILVMTNAIRDLHLAWPGRFETEVRTPCPDIFNNNPYITKLKYDEAEYCNTNTWFAANPGKTKMLGDIMCIDMQYPLIHSSGARGAHFAEGHREFLESTLGIKIPQTKISPELYLNDIEKSGYGIRGKYWVINAGSKSDYTLKQYPYYQEVIDLLKDKIQFVQIGVKSHLHKPLEGVIDMVGNTDSIRDLFSLINMADGVLTCVSLPMHVAAALKSPCVVVAGAREGTRWELYPNHRFIYVNGCLPCAKHDGCWKSKDSECVSKKDGVPKCMSLIKPQEVAREIERYYEGGVLKYDTKEPVILNLKEGEDIVKETKVLFPPLKDTKTHGTTGNSGGVVQCSTIINKQVSFEFFPRGINSPQATASVFNILRILKKILPADNYLEAYQWHYSKRKDKFMDTYHFLQFLGATVRPKRILEIGTRTGISICQLLSAYMNYDNLEKVVLCDLFNDGLSTPEVVWTALRYLNIPDNKVMYIKGDSIIEIPKLIARENSTFDYILVDGCHEKAAAKQDLIHATCMIEKGGHIIFDDITPDGCSLQDVWDEFKENNYKDFTFMENHDGKGLGVAIRNKI